MAALLLSVLGLGCLDADLVHAARLATRARLAAVRAGTARALAPASLAGVARPDAAVTAGASAAPTPPGTSPEGGVPAPHPCACTHADVTFATTPAVPAGDLAPDAPPRPAATSDRLPASPPRERPLRPPVARVA